MSNADRGTQTEREFRDDELSRLDSRGLGSIFRERPSDSSSLVVDRSTGCRLPSPRSERGFLARPSRPCSVNSEGQRHSPRPKSPWGRFDPYDSNEDQETEYVGFATLPNQVQRKSVKKGFEFTLMVVGESGLGKSTLVSSLFLTDLYKDRKVFDGSEKIAQTVSITKKTVTIEEKGVKLKLNIVDTPGFGDAMDNSENWKEVSDYIDRQFEQYRKDEIGVNRKNIQDNRVHCCLYFISTCGHGLKPLDVQCLRALQDKVNIIPVLAKADTLTQTELQRMKARILSELDDYKINIYQFPDCNSDEDDDFSRQDMELKRCVPFAVIGSNSVIECNGRRLRTRVYPWGEVEVENPAHCDFVHLRNMLVRTHMQDLKDMTQETHYEKYRSMWLRRSKDQDDDFCNFGI